MLRRRRPRTGKVWRRDETVQTREQASIQSRNGCAGRMPGLESGMNSPSPNYRVFTSSAWWRLCEVTSSVTWLYRYYGNTESKQTTWTRPPEGWRDRNRVRKVHAEKNLASTVSPKLAPLPLPWVQQRDPKTGYAFFVNLRTKQRVWKDPRLN